MEEIFEAFIEHDSRSENIATGNTFFNTEATNVRPELYTEEEISALRKAFPEADAEALKNDSDFKIFLLGGDSLLSAYRGYLSLSKSIEAKAYKKLKAREANERASVGALSSSQRQTDSYFTKEQVLKMSKEDIKRNFTKIRESQRHW